MPSLAFPLFCSWAPYCLVDQCLRSQLLVFRNFKLNPVIAQYSGEHRVHCHPSVRWVRINQSSLGRKTPGNPARASRAQASVGLMSDFGPQRREESVLLFLWCGDYRRLQRTGTEHFPTKWCDWITRSLAFPEVAWKNWLDMEEQV